MSLVFSRFVLLLLLPGLLCARDRDTASWQNVQALSAGVQVQVSRKTGPPVSGSLESVSAASIAVRAGQQPVSISRGDVTRVAAKGRRRAKWIGLAVGAGAGAGAGAALGARLANESAGNLDVKALSTVAVMAVGGLIGLVIGGALDLRHATVYQVQ